MRTWKDTFDERIGRDNICNVIRDVGYEMTLMTNDAHQILKHNRKNFAMYLKLYKL